MYIKRYITLPALLTVMLFAGKATAQTPGFVQTDVPKTAVATDAALYALPLANRQTAKVYYDGLGRAIQSIAVEASPSEKDIIQPVAYDALGRQTTGYLPYTSGSSSEVMGSYRANALTAQAAFYNNTSQYVIPVDADPYSQRVFENSPLQRTLSAGMAGAGFQPVSGSHYKKVNYRPDSTTDGNILLWYTNGTYSGTYYASKTLSVTDAVDEDNVEILTFTDKMGHVILKRQKLGSTNYDTYYIYNNAGIISYIIPPAATSRLAANSYSLTAAPISPLLFQYKYNVRGQLTQRTIPGKGIMYIVYDPLNRPVLMQDANMHLNNQWNYIKYDAKGRAISQGIYTDAGHTSLTAMQQHVDSLNYNTYWYETRNSSSTYMYYTNNVFPTANATALAYAYFDDYKMTGGGTPTFSYVAQKDISLPNEESPTTAQVKGMPTVVTKTTVGAGISGEWFTSVTFYDRNLHVIQQQSNNQLNYTNATTVTDFKTVVNDFTGMPTNSKVTKKRTGSDTVSIYTTITYDQAYRLIGISQKYNTGPNNPVAAYNYNEVGQLILKNLGYVSSGSWLQNEDFRYNIRGWLMSINNSKLTRDGGMTNNDSNDVFGMQLMYDKADSALVNTKRYNGKPSGVKWMTRNYSNTRTLERSYLFNYDAGNRYTGETYAERDSLSTGPAAFSINQHGFDEYGINYDPNGNMSKLSRNSSTIGGLTPQQIDTLALVYNTNNANQLVKVTDGTDAAHTGNGFRNITDSTANYEYDANGNLYNDHYKGMQLRYNVLNRTDKINITPAGGSQYIDYTYDADGNLLRKRAFSGGTVQTTTDYIDGFVYITITTGTAALSYFPMPEGRVLFTSPNTYTQEFIITDQQGNARVAFRASGSTPHVAIVYQENSYYGTGLILPNSPVSTPAVPNKKLYNGGSEWQNDSASGTYNLPDYYETFNRNYDAAIGRFIGVDPQAESAESMSSYQYGGDNPIVSNDPSGGRAGIPQYQNNNVNEFNQSGSTNLASLYGDVAGVTGFNDNINGLYYTDQGAYWEAYFASGGTFGGTRIYHAGNGTADDPHSGLSIASLSGYLRGIAAGYGIGNFNASGNKIYYNYNVPGEAIDAADGVGQGSGVINHYGVFIDTDDQGGEQPFKFPLVDPITFNLRAIVNDQGHIIYQGNVTHAYTTFSWKRLFSPRITVEMNFDVLGFTFDANGHDMYTARLLLTEFMNVAYTKIFSDVAFGKDMTEDEAKGIFLNVMDQLLNSKFGENAYLNTSPILGAPSHNLAFLNNNTN